MMKNIKSVMICALLVFLLLIAIAQRVEGTNELSDCKLPESIGWWYNDGTQRYYTDLYDYCEEQRYTMNKWVVDEKKQEDVPPNESGIKEQWKRTNHEFKNYKMDWKKPADPDDGGYCGVKE